jgi:hypothetical protein
MPAPKAIPVICVLAPVRFLTTIRQECRAAVTLSLPGFHAASYHSSLCSGRSCTNPIISMLLLQKTIKRIIRKSFIA